MALDLKPVVVGVVGAVALHAAVIYGATAPAWTVMSVLTTVVAGAVGGWIGAMVYPFIKR